MTQIEYKVELMVFHEGEDVRRAELLAQLNELGKEGWRLIAIDPLRRAGAGWTPAKPIPMFLLREVAR